MNSSVSEKGQVTIPKAIRERLGLRPGTVIEFRAENGRLIGTKAIAEDVFRKWRGRGRLPGGLSVDAYLGRSRGPHAHGR
jgi:AbrB family looped-hinge helix DNA binding protein